MSMRIEGISDLGRTTPFDATPPTSTGAGAVVRDASHAASSFGGVLVDMVREADATQREATDRAQALARGASDDLHGTMIAVKEADIQMRFIGAIRTKVVDAIHELWRTNV